MEKLLNLIRLMPIIFLISSISTAGYADYKTKNYIKFLSQSNEENTQQKETQTFGRFIDIKKQKIDNCITGTIKYKIADRSTANKLCSCTIGVRSQMTIGQLWEIESYAQSGIDPNTLPYVMKMQEDLQKCTVGLILNPPQKP
ncbi:MAG: hypothetical protein KGV51_04190 [Moraxellaceae bacterium]|nr:hypothetical protein [Moraxellaceae bacterium]